MELKIKHFTLALVGIVAMAVTELASGCNNKNPVSCSEMHRFVTEEIAKSIKFSPNYLQCTGSPSNCMGTACGTIANNYVIFPQSNCNVTGSNISIPDANGKITLSPGTYYVSYYFSPAICRYIVGTIDSMGVQIVSYLNNMPYLDSSTTMDSLASAAEIFALKSVSAQFIVKVESPNTTTVNFQYFAQGNAFSSTTQFAIDAYQASSLCNITPNPIQANGSSLSIQQIG